MSDLLIGTMFRLKRGWIAFFGVSSTKIKMAMAGRSAFHPTETIGGSERATVSGRKLPSYFGSVAPRNGRGTSIRVRRPTLGDQVNRRGLSDDMGRLHEAQYSTVTPRCLCPVQAERSGNVEVPKSRRPLENPSVAVLHWTQWPRRVRRRCPPEPRGTPRTSIFPSALGLILHVFD